MKKLILAIALTLSGFVAIAQTVDYTGVSINTERVKKTYATHMAVLGTGVMEAGLRDEYFTGELGARFVWAQLFGFYVGVEIGVGGLPFSNESLPINFGNYHRSGSTYDYDLYSFTVQNEFNDSVGSAVVDHSKTRYARYTFSLGAVLRLGKHADLYLGSGVAMGRDYVQYASDVIAVNEVLKNNRYNGSDFNIAPAPELGGYFYVGHVALMVGASYVPPINYRFHNLRLHFGVGYKF